VCFLFTSTINSTLVFFYFHFAKFPWRAVQVTFNIDIPIYVEHMFNNWANSIPQFNINIPIYVEHMFNDWANSIPQLRKFLLIGQCELIEMI
jgi:hypothetical protein